MMDPELFSPILQEQITALQQVLESRGLLVEDEYLGPSSMEIHVVLPEPLRPLTYLKLGTRSEFNEVRSHRIEVKLRGHLSPPTCHVKRDHTLALAFSGFTLLAGASFVTAVVMLIKSIHQGSLVLALCTVVPLLGIGLASAWVLRRWALGAVQAHAQLIEHAMAIAAALKIPAEADSAR